MQSIEPDQARFDGAICRAARALLAMSQVELCERAELSRKLLNDFENGIRSPKVSTVAKLRSSLEQAGAVFVRIDDLLMVGARGRSQFSRSPRSRGFAQEADDTTEESG